MSHTQDTEALVTLLGNLNHAVWSRETVSIGGGQFTPDELESSVRAIRRLMTAAGHLTRVTHPMADDTDVDAAVRFLNDLEG